MLHHASSLPYQSSGYHSPDSRYHSESSQVATYQPRVSGQYSDYTRSTPDSDAMSPSYEYTHLERSSERYSNMHQDCRNDRERGSQRGSLSPSDRKSSMNGYSRASAMDISNLTSDRPSPHRENGSEPTRLPGFDSFLRTIEGTSSHSAPSPVPPSHSSNSSRPWDGLVHPPSNTRPMSTSVPILPPPPQWSPSEHQYGAPHYPHSQASGYPPTPNHYQGPGHIENRSRPRYNKEYTPEQIHFCLYTFIDKKLNWQETLEQYSARFPDDQHRGTAGLQGVMYRENKCFPVTDVHGHLVWDHEKEKWLTKDFPIRQQTEKIGLLHRYPDAALDYDWVDPVDKESIRRIGKIHKAQRREMAEMMRRKNGRVNGHHGFALQHHMQGYH